MTTNPTRDAVPATAESVSDALARFLLARTGSSVAADHDLFDSGLVTSMFAMELVVYLEKTYGVSIVGADLRLDNFRTIDAMTALVLRLTDG